MEKLPVELLARILRLSDLSHNARLACRLVCRGFCSVLNPEAFHRIRTSEFSRNAFDRLVNLSQSPLAQFLVDYEYKLIPFLSAKDVHDVDPLVQLTSNFDTLSVQGMAKSLVQHHKTHLHQIDILGTFYDIISLSKSLPAFINLKSVTISRFDGSEQAPLGYESATTRAFWAVIKALNNCPFRIESFTIDSLYYTTLIDIPTSNLRQIQRVLEHLKHLSILKLSVATEMADRHIRTILEEEIIGQTPGLEVLRIGNADSWRVGPYDASELFLALDDFGHLGRNSSSLFHWPHLRVLEMKSRATIQQDRIIAFLEGHGQTLRELKLKGFALRASPDPRQPSDWKTVFEKLKISLVLKKLTLSELRTENRRALGDGFSRVTEAQLSEWEKWVPRFR